jgi:hypothetical protein
MGSRAPRRRPKAERWAGRSSAGASARRERLGAGLAETQDAPLLAFAAERELV